MTLDEALAAKRLLYLVPFEGWQACRGLTGFYYYDTSTNSENEKDIKVQVKTGWFKREWVPLILLKEVKEANK